MAYEKTQLAHIVKLENALLPLANMSASRSADVGFMSFAVVLWLT